MTVQNFFIVYSTITKDNNVVMLASTCTVLSTFHGAPLNDQVLTQVLEGLPFNNEHALYYSLGSLPPENTSAYIQHFSLVVLYGVLVCI